MIEKIAELDIVKEHYKGKVRDIFDLGEQLLIVTSDRISAYDVVFPNIIPNKGKILNQISVFFFKKTKHIMQNHFISDDINDFPQELHQFKDYLADRSMLVKKTKVIPFECIVRGYITGSAWKEYKMSKSIGGLPISEEMQESERFATPIFTPSTKADNGHDENISFDEMKKRLDINIAKKLQEKSIELYNFVHSFLQERDIILADTKFEFGTKEGEIFLIDEIFTPDSSRFWDVKLYEVGATPKSYDKQFVRDYISDTGWNKQPPAPKLPQNIIVKSYEKYFEIYEKIVGDGVKKWG